MRTPTSVPIRVAGDPHTMWIAPKKTFGVEQRIYAAVRGDVPFIVALVAGFVQDWEGPGLTGTIPSVATVTDLDAAEDSPLVAALLGACLERWIVPPPPVPEAADPDPNPATAPATTDGPPILPDASNT